jgi:hypothetical protein
MAKLVAVAYAFTFLIGLTFGAADQYLGSRSALGAWAVAVSQMSAPWLLLPFLVGMTQEDSRRAMALGLVVTAPALLGYFAMTCSPVENVPLPHFSTCLLTVAGSAYNPIWILGGILFAPVYGLLGQRWRVSRSWVGPVLVTCTLCLEPLARSIVGFLSPGSVVWVVEIVAGLVVAICFVLAITSSRRTRGTIPRAG